MCVFSNQLAKPLTTLALPTNLSPCFNCHSQALAHSHARPTSVPPRSLPNTLTLSPHPPNPVKLPTPSASPTPPQMPGVISVSVNLVSQTATVQHIAALAGPRDIVHAIEDCGFEASLLPPGGRTAATGGTSGGTAASPLAREATAWRARLVVGALLSAPVMVLAMAAMVPGWMGVLEAPVGALFGLPWSWVVQAVFSTAVQVVVGAAFYKSAWKGLKRGEPNMQVGLGNLG